VIRTYQEEKLTMLNDDDAAMLRSKLEDIKHNKTGGEAV